MATRKPSTVHRVGPGGVPEKRCYRCGEWKDQALGFYASKHTRDHVTDLCRACFSAYNARPDRKAARERYAASKRGKVVMLAAVRRYQKTDKGRAVAKAVDARRNKAIRRRVMHNIRSRMRQHILARRDDGLSRIIGCGWDALRAHIETGFAPGMSWDNYGEWHIDHIRPLALCDHEDMGDIKRFWHFTNLQPLWGSDNCSKGARLDWTPQHAAEVTP